MKVKNYSIFVEKDIPDTTIAVGADFHISKKTKNKKIQEVLDTFDSIKPTCIVMPGDLYNVDYKTVYSDDTKVIDFLNQATEIAPVYYAPGNSELKCDFLPEGLTNNTNPNLHILCDSSKEFWEMGERNPKFTDMVVTEDMTVSAIKLPLEFYGMHEYQKSRFLLDNITLGYLIDMNFETDENKLNILICHDPYIITLARYLNQIDLVLSGHNHGGLFKEELKPLLKKLKADLELLYPTYIKGLWHRGNPHFVISEGITKYHTDMGALQHLDRFHEGTIEVTRVRSK